MAASSTLKRRDGPLYLFLKEIIVVIISGMGSFHIVTLKVSNYSIGFSLQESLAPSYYNQVRGEGGSGHHSFILSLWIYLRHSVNYICTKC